MTSPGSTEGYVNGVVDRATARLTGDEVLLAAFQGESSDFVRFNNGAVRQAGSVQQLSVDLDMVAGRRHTTASIQLSGVTDLDDKRFSVPGIIEKNMRENRNGIRDGQGFYDYRERDMDAYRQKRMGEFVKLLQHLSLLPKAG